MPSPPPLLPGVKILWPPRLVTRVGKYPISPRIAHVSIRPIVDAMGENSPAPHDCRRVEKPPDTPPVRQHLVVVGNSLVVLDEEGVPPGVSGSGSRVERLESLDRGGIPSSVGLRVSGLRFHGIGDLVGMTSHQFHVEPNVMFDTIGRWISRA